MSNRRSACRISEPVDVNDKIDGKTKNKIMGQIRGILMHKILVAVLIIAVLAACSMTHSTATPTIIPRSVLEKFPSHIDVYESTTERCITPSNGKVYRFTLKFDNSADFEESLTVKVKSSGYLDDVFKSSLIFSSCLNTRFPLVEVILDSDPGSSVLASTAAAVTYRCEPVSNRGGVCKP